MLKKRMLTKCYMLPLLTAALAFVIAMHYMDNLKAQNTRLTQQMARLETTFHAEKDKFMANLQEGEFEVTAYEPSDKSCGKWSKLGLTKSGTSPNKLRTVAVDPDVIPIGSLVYIEGIGWRVAEDTGSRVKGRIIDLFVESIEEAKEFGRQKKTVYYNKA
ncbi:MAG: 3D domain-containing protein [Candidatus Magnetominusculus sp. LBB02]|nr:3D domain-containing protein [Candidatus Magnetominusculus sp. LBB02]